KNDTGSPNDRLHHGLPVLDDDVEVDATVLVLGLQLRFRGAERFGQAVDADLARLPDALLCCDQLAVELEDALIGQPLGASCRVGTRHDVLPGVGGSSCLRARASCRS